MQTQIRIVRLIWLLIKMLSRKGNALVYYHCIGGAWDCPLEVEGIEIRSTLLGDKVTVY